MKEWNGVFLSKQLHNKKKQSIHVIFKRISYNIDNFNTCLLNNSNDNDSSELV
jgi:hypothetical protein